MELHILKWYGYLLSTYYTILVHRLGIYSLRNYGDIFGGKQGLNTPEKIHIKTHVGKK